MKYRIDRDQHLLNVKVQTGKTHIYKTIIQHLTTGDTDTFICLFVHCTILLAVATPVRQTFTTDVGQMLRGDII